jgi:hypothetical protein
MRQRRALTREADKAEKKRIMDKLAASIGYHRKDAISLLLNLLTIGFGTGSFFFSSIPPLSFFPKV